MLKLSGSATKYLAMWVCKRIDVMPSLIENGQRALVPIELKAVEGKDRYDPDSAIY
jgi:hypothetical protein